MSSNEKTLVGFAPSPQQVHLWRLRPEAGDHFRTACAVSIEGALDAARLKSALELAVERNEILRTTFQQLPEMSLPLQVIEEDGDLSFDYVEELCELAPKLQARRVEELFERLSSAPSRAEDGPPLSATLLKLSEQTHVLLLSLPALCMDATGMRLLAREVFDCYLFETRGTQEEPAPRQQYADLCGWLTGLLEDEQARPEREFWRSPDHWGPTPDRLYFETQASDEESPFVPRVWVEEIDARLAAAVESLAARRASSKGALLLSLWGALLARLSGGAELTVGVLTDGRSYEELEDVLGLFEKYVPVRCAPAGGLRIADAAARTDEALRRAADVQEYFDWQPPAGDGGGRPRAFFFPYCFGFDEAAASHAAGGLSFTVSMLYACHDRFKLKLSVSRAAGGALRAEFHYDASRFGEENVRRIAARFVRLLRSAADAPEARLGELRVIPDEERARILGDFNRSEADFSRPLCLQHLFEEHAARTPGGTAVVYEDRRLTYDELNRASNQLAHHLRASGVGPEVRVGVLVERSTELIVCLLAVLKAGGAYVPLEPGQQKERLSAMLREAGVRVLLTDQPPENVPPHGAVEVRLDAVAAAAARESEANPSVAVSPENLMYVLFTSGSTGQPKGVLIEHRQAFNYLRAVAERFGLREGASYATVSTFAADLGNTAVFPALFMGGVLHVISPEKVLSPDDFAAYMSGQAVDVLKIVPTHLRALLGSERPADVLPRELLILGGEALSRELAGQLQTLGAGCRIFNHYGPTETTVGVLTHAVAQGDAASRSVPLGRPLANTKVYILDSGFEPADILTPGEIYVGGANVGRGYLNHPALTAERFVPDPFGREPGARLYRTGDLGRYHPDGVIEFLGRADHQVKVRGYRVELGEVEGVLSRHPDAKECVVVADGELTGEKRLVAYLVPRAGARPTAGSLRGFCRAELPEHMIPSEFVLLKSLPLLPNGKVDRRGLRETESLQLNPEDAYVPPQTEVEKAISAAWREVLGVERVGVHDNFFDLGGHSLLMMQVHNALGKAFPSAGLSIIDLFKHPTVSALGKFLSEGQGAQPTFQNVHERVRRQVEAFDRRKQNRVRRRGE